MSKLRTGLIIIAGTLLLAADAPSQEGYKIIVNTANPVSALGKAQVSRFFLEHATWDNGQAVVPVDLPSGSPVRDAFSRDMLSLTVQNVVARNSGRSDAPPSVATDREVLAFVRLKPGGIGYVSAATETAGVKVIAIGRSDTVASAGEPVEVGGAIPVPERLSAVQPVYPPIARASRLQGDVDLEIVISATGEVERARVVRSAHSSLEDAAINAVKQWKYRPTRVNGASVAVKTRVRISFAL